MAEVHKFCLTFDDVQVVLFRQFMAEWQAAGRDFTCAHSAMKAGQLRAYNTFQGVGDIQVTAEREPTKGTDQYFWVVWLQARYLSSLFHLGQAWEEFRQRTLLPAPGQEGGPADG